MRSHFSGWVLVALALVLNLGSSPWAVAGLGHAAPTAPASEHCASHGQAAGHGAAVHHEPPAGQGSPLEHHSCCAGGACVCSCPAAPALSLRPATAQLLVAFTPGPAASVALFPAPPDNLFRPPIA